jgi:alpha,alpha-trehalase
MAVWVLARALELLHNLPEERCGELRERLQFGDEELKRWDDISRKILIPFHTNGVISQFEGYDALKEFPLERYREKYGNIHRLDRILEAEGDTPNRYKVSKQADVLMLFYLFSAEELAELFERLGYTFEHETIPQTVEYYARRTTHGSSLSRVVWAWVVARGDRTRSWKIFHEALRGDVEDTQSGTTPEGIHLGAMAGTVDFIQRCYPGIVMRGNTLWLNLCLPEDLTSLTMSMRYRGHALDLHFTQGTVKVRARTSNATPIRIGIRDAVYELRAGDTRRFQSNGTEEL